MCRDGLGTVDATVANLIPVPSQWPEFFSWAAGAFTLDYDDSWDPSGEDTPWLASLPYGKMINAIYLLAYALRDDYATQWHSRSDYLTAARAMESGFHGPFFLRFADGSGEAESKTGRFAARDRTDVHCAVFDFQGASDDPCNRASVLVHESWHHWQYAKGYKSDHLTGGSIGAGLEGDYYYFHHVHDFDFGVLDQYRLSPILFHSPYQVQAEFDADIAECSNGWVPVAVTQSARYYGNTRLANQFFNPASYRIANPRPF
ncbi:MAG: hypothetical protein QOG25_795 [Acetobacteraceae bacterium]|nr:hypothetical protein [Acetobacteraceae bacterium]